MGLDQLIAHLGGGAALPVVLAVAFVLGLRHASDPDHLVAVSTLVATERDRPVRRASALGLAWGAGHMLAVVALGLPVVLFGAELPGGVAEAAEALVGVTIVALALRLLVRWRRGGFHAHQHAHGGTVHRHLHAHSHAGHDHDHRLVRSRPQAFGIGCLHGVGGSAPVAALLLSTIAARATAAAALGVFAVGTALSMALLSSGIGFALARPAVGRRLVWAAPALALCSLAFGGWYTLAALGGVP